MSEEFSYEVIESSNQHHATIEDLKLIDVIMFNKIARELDIPNSYFKERRASHVFTLAKEKHKRL